MKAFILLIRYSALRIGDASRLRKDQLDGTRLLLYTQKTGVPVYVPLPQFVVDALAACRHSSEIHFFWTGESSRENTPKIWDLNLDRVFRKAGIEGAHPQRFRDTFAVELLLEGEYLSTWCQSC